MPEHFLPVLKAQATSCVPEEVSRLPLPAHMKRAVDTLARNIAEVGYNRWELTCVPRSNHHAHRHAQADRLVPGRNPSVTREPGLIHQSNHQGAAQQHPILQFSAAHALARHLDPSRTCILQQAPKLGDLPPCTPRRHKDPEPPMENEYRLQSKSCDAKATQQTLHAWCPITAHPEQPLHPRAVLLNVLLVKALTGVVRVGAQRDGHQLH